MKTSLALYVMLKNRENGGKGLYITLEESRESLLTTMERLGLGSEEDFIVDLGKLRIDHSDAEERRDWLQILRDYFTRRLEKDKLDLVVVDPLNSLYSLMGIRDPRKDLFHFFSFLRGMGATSILISETGAGGPAFENHEDYLADGAIVLDFAAVENPEPVIELRCPKMRHANHSRATYRLAFSGGRFAVSGLAED